MRRHAFAVPLILLVWAGLLAAQAAPQTAPTGATPVAPPADSEKAKDIRRLLEVTGSARLGVQIVDQLLASFRQNQAQVPESFWDELKRELDASALIDLVVPIYNRHLSHDDVKQLLAFYESPAGQKLLSVQPQIMSESMQAGQEWGRATAERVLERLRQKGYGPKPS